MLLLMRSYSHLGTGAYTEPERVQNEEPLNELESKPRRK